jgi:hypothetical protein
VILDRPWLEIKGGEEIGRDPREVSPSELNEWGHNKKPILHAIRERCFDCCVFQASEVRKCVSVNCPSWPYRMGTDPFTERKGNAESLKRARQMASAPA